MSQALKYRKACKTCTACKGNWDLRQRLNHAMWDREEGDETLAMIGRDIHVSQPQVRNHMLKHAVMPNVRDSRVKTEKAIHRVKAMVDKELELSFDHAEVVPETDYEKLLSAVIAESIKRIKNGDVKVSVSQGIAAAKIKAEYAAKKRGQDTEIIKTMYRMASGNKTEASAGTTGTVVEAGPEQSGDIHNQAARYAAARGAEEVPPVSQE